MKIELIEPYKGWRYHVDAPNGGGHCDTFAEAVAIAAKGIRGDSYEAVIYERRAHVSQLGLVAIVDDPDPTAETARLQPTDDADD